MQRKVYLYLMLFLGISVALTAGCASTSNMGDESPVGSWDYIIPNTPEGEAYGTLLISSSNNAYTGEMYIDLFDQTVPLEDIVFGGGNLSFRATLNAGGQPMGTSANMKLDGDKMSGTVEVDGVGKLDIAATRNRANE